MKRLVKCTKQELEYLDPVMGQLSDGMWENSPKMEAYWLCNSLTDDGIEMEDYTTSFSGRKTYWNPLYKKSDEEVRSWFADKLKAVVKHWLEDYGSSGEGWNRLNTAEVDYLRNGQTVAGAYKAYDSLKGRPSKEGKEVKVKVSKLAKNLEVGDMIERKKIVKVIQPITSRDNIVTIVYDNDEVQRVIINSQVEVTQIKVIE